MSDSPTRSIVIFLAVGALSVTLNESSPSLPILAAFLISVSLVGSQYTDLLSDSITVRIGLAIPVGLAIVVLAMLLQFGTSPKLLLSARTFIAATLFLASLLATGIHIYHGRNKKIVSSSGLDQDDEHKPSPRIGYLLIFAVFVLALLIRFALQSTNTSTVLPDAALFYSAARSLAQNNTFSTNVLNDVPGASPYLYAQGGLIPHTGTWLLLGSFFTFGGVSFEVDKILLVLFGSVLVFPICLLASVWYGKQLAWLSGLIVAVQPILLFFSVVPFGPEILSVTMAFSGIAILETSRRLELSRYSATILSGLLLGVSCIIWEPRLVIVYLMGYALSLLIVYRVSMPWVWVLIAATAGLGLNMFLTSNSILNPPLFMLALPIMAVLISRRHKQLSSFLWVAAIVGLIYSLWLARWYLYPQLSIYGVTTPTSNLLPGSLQAASSGGLDASINLYWQLLQLASLKFIILLAFLSIVFVSIPSLRRSTFPFFYILTNLMVIVLFYTTEAGFFLGYTATRLLLGSAVAFILLASGAIIGIFDDLLIGSRRSKLGFNVRKNSVHVSSLPGSVRKNNRFGSIGRPAYAIALLLMMSVLTVAISQEFSSGYNHSADFAKAVDYPNIMGVTASVPWITKNTPSNATFLVTSGNTGRVWAMALESRSFAALWVLFKNGTVAPYKDIGLSDVVAVSNQLGARYIIMDPIMLWYPGNNITSFYSQIQSDDVNRTFAVIPANTTLQNILDSRTLSAVRVVYVSNDTAKKVVILRPTTGSMKTTWADNFTSAGDWSVQLNGSLTSALGNLTLTAPSFSNDVYAAHTFQRDLNVTNSTFIIFRSRQDAASYSGYYLQFKSGKSTSMIFDAGGLHAISLAQYAGESIQTMFLYNLLADKAGGSAVRHAVTYDFVLIGDLVRR